MKQIYYLLDYDKIVPVEVDSDRFLDDVYELLGCTCIDIAHSLIPGVCMVVDDIGALRDYKKLNYFSSLLYHYHLFGKALLCYEDGPDLVPLPPFLLSRVFSFFDF